MAVLHGQGRRLPPGARCEVEPSYLDRTRLQRGDVQEDIAAIGEVDGIFFRRMRSSDMAAIPTR